MPLIEIKNTSDKSVLVQMRRVVEDGRQMLPNGESIVEPGETEQFIVSGKQTLTIVEQPEPVIDEAAAEDGAATE